METVIEILKEEGFGDDEVLTFKVCKELISYLQPIRLPPGQDFDKSFEVVDFCTEFKSIADRWMDLSNEINLPLTVTNEFLTNDVKFLTSLAFLTHIVERNKFSYLEEIVRYLVSQRNV